DLGSGLAGAAETSRCVANSAALRDVMRYVEYAEEIPFARPVPHFPVFKKRAPTPSFAQLGETPPHPHIPSWLPAFPDPHTYCHTPVWNERKSDPRLDKLEQARQRRKAERSLVSLHLRLSGPGAVVSDGSNNNLLNLVATTHHPFLAAPLSAGEKEVALVTPFRGTTELHAQNQDSHGPAALPSVLEAFAPALEAVKKGFEVVDSGSRPLKEKQQTFIAETKDRMPVSLTFDWGQKTRAKALAAKRCLAQPVSPPSNKRGRGNASSWKEEEKDEKSKRAEQILAQAMEESEE
ncbi:unnamed protein product, partial [Sphagnum balticum]